MKNVLFSWNKENEELITHLTMVIGRQFSYWSCKLGYFNLSFVVPLKASKKNLSLSWFHTYNNNLKTWNKVNHLFTPPAANNFPGPSLRGRRQGFSLATINVVPSYFHRKTEEKYNQKKSLQCSCLIPHLLVVFTRKLEILVTSPTACVEPKPLYQKLFPLKLVK